MTTAIAIICFTCGFVVGYLRREDKEKMPEVFKLKRSGGGEVLVTPSVEEQEKEEAKTFYNAMK
jgi:hypothetical protein